MERQKLRTHLLINIISFVVIIFVIMTGLLVIFTSQTVENMIFEKTDDTLRIIEVEMEHYINHPIKEIKIIGLVKTDPKVITRELLFKSDDWYNPQKIINTRKTVTQRKTFICF